MSSRQPQASTTSSVLDKIRQLRDFCGDQQQWTDADYTDCLRQHVYSVERAAEALMTGQYKRPAARNSQKKKVVVNLLTPPQCNDRPSVGAAHHRPRAKRALVLAPSSQSSRKKAASRPHAPSISPTNTDRMVRTMPSSTSPTSLSPTMMLLCERWISNAINTEKYGETAYDQVVLVTASPHKLDLRFRGGRVQGKLPDDLAAFLVPLIRVAAVHAEARSLMAERRLAIGAHVPLSVRIYVEPRCFFGLFRRDDDDEAARSKSSSSSTSSSYPNNVKNGKTTAKATSRSALAQAAFQLLQWAEKGNVPTFAVVTKSDHTRDDDDDDKAAAVDDWNDEPDHDSTSSQQDHDDRLAGLEHPTTTTTTTLPLADPPPGFVHNVTLRDYQRQALHWMWQRETAGETEQQVTQRLALLAETAGHATTNTTNNNSNNNQTIVCDCGPVQVPASRAPPAHHHPLWQRRFLASPDLMHSADSNNNANVMVQPFYVHELLGQATLEEPPAPQPCSGGILADSMGLGKTVMLLALLLKSQQENQRPGSRHHQTLVVAKLSLLPQWEEEIRSKTNLTHQVYYGAASKGLDWAATDVVVTTYGTLQAEWTSQSNSSNSSSNHPPSSSIFSFRWHRVILDEAHCIRNPRTRASQACCRLPARHRWCVTGTIIQNSLEDIYGLLKFLRHEPWCMAPFWKAAITQPSAAGKHNNNNNHSNTTTTTTNENNANTASEPDPTVALDRVRRLLAPIYLRRTKDSRTTDGQPILTLPPKETKTVYVDFEPSEREFYNAMLARSQDIFEGFVQAGKASKSYLQIFGMLQRLRQVCDHIALTVQTRFHDKARRAKSPAAAPDAENAATDPAPEALGKVFLEGLLTKFCTRKDHVAEPDMPRVDYLQNVAGGLSQVVTDKDATHWSEECSICLEAPRVEDVVLTPCAHIFCRECLVGYLRRNDENAANRKNHLAAFSKDISRPCPNCNESIVAKDVVALSRSSTDGTVTSHHLMDRLARNNSNPAKPELSKRAHDKQQARAILSQAVEGSKSSKIVAILAELEEIWTLDGRSKVLLFSHYLGFLDLMEIHFREAGIPFFRLDGSLSLQERMSVLESFRKASKGTVLLMSMMAGAEGLNLVSASACFLCDPWWNQAKEDQCINRIHRIGQVADQVRVRRFIMRDSVEERILALQDRKKYVADEIYDTSKTGSKEAGTARLGLEDFRLIFRR